MISRKELQFVNKKVGNIPYPGDEYAEAVMAELKEAYNLYNSQYNGKSYSMILSDGQEFQFSIMDKNLCHMLGISTKQLFNNEAAMSVASNVLGINGYTPTYEILQKIIDNSDAIIDNERKEGTFKLLNFYKIMVKSAIFKKMSTFKDFDFGFINFDKDKFNNNISYSTYSPNSTKYIFMPSEEVLIPYFMVGFVQDNNSEFHVPETVIAPEDYYKFFIDQELVLPLQVLIDDNQNFTKWVASPQEKLKLLSRYKNIISKYNTRSKINIYNDYETVLTELASKGNSKRLTM